MKSSLSLNQKRLMFRYLTWCYKTTKEDLDRIDRYFTQLFVDDFLLRDLHRSKELKQNENFMKLVNDFEDYRRKKEEKVLSQKFINAEKKEEQPQYLYLHKRFESIQKAIVHFLGKKALKQIADMYETEMTKRILEAREHS